MITEPEQRHLCQPQGTRSSCVQEEAHLGPRIPSRCAINPAKAVVRAVLRLPRNERDHSAIENVKLPGGRKSRATLGEFAA